VLYIYKLYEAWSGNVIKLPLKHSLVSQNFLLTDNSCKILYMYILSWSLFISGKLAGMNENSTKLKLSEDRLNPKAIVTGVMTAANVLQVTSTEENIYRFAAKTLAGQLPVLVTLVTKEGNVKLTTNCEKMVIGAMLMKDIKQSLES